MCDYGKTRKENLNKRDIVEIMNEVFANLIETPDVVLLNSLGSVLDTEEMPIENIMELLDELSKINIKVIIFETHYLSINTEILKLIHQKLPNKDIVIELGLESSNKEIREKCLNKYINNEKFIEKVRMIKLFGFGVDANIIFGTPFLKKEEQIQDTVNSIKWCIENNLDKVNLFPINIKPYTLLYRLYEDGKYFPVSHKDFMKVLTLIPEEYIDRIYLCWYGNRELKYDKKKTVLPLCEDAEYEKIMNFYKKFNMDRNKDLRLKLLREIKSWLND